MGQHIELFSSDEINYAFRQKRKLFILWIFALVGYLGFIATEMIINYYRVSNFYDRSDRIWMSVSAVIVTVMFVCGSMFFFSVKYALTKNYVKMLRNMRTGTKDKAEVKFLRFDDTTTVKDGVTFYTMVTEAKPLGRMDITERRILIEHTKPKPKVVEGERLSVVTHANILVSYENKSIDV